MNKIKSFIKRGYRITFGIVILLVFLAFLLSAILASFNVLLLGDSIFMNRLAIYAMVLSVPIAFEQLIESISSRKRRFKGSMICPNCNKTAEINIEEI